MRYTIAEVKRAVLVLKTEKRFVTFAALARKMDADPRDIRNFITNIRNFQEEIGIVHFGRSRRAQYIRSMELLRDAGLLITYSRIAALSQSSPKAVRGWLARHPTVREMFSITSGSTLRQRRCFKRLPWSVWHRRAHGLPVTMKALASDVGYECCAFYRLLRGHEELKRELGFA